jgi:hypothetical protein
VPAILLLTVCVSCYAGEPVVDDKGFHHFCLEAEDFVCKDGGWKPTWQGYFAASPNNWSRNKLEADAGDQLSQASQRTYVRKAGTYRLFVRYEATYGFGNVFGVSVLQGGRSLKKPKAVFDKKYGFREDRVHNPWRG